MIKNKSFLVFGAAAIAALTVSVNINSAYAIAGLGGTCSADLAACTDNLTLSEATVAALTQDVSNLTTEATTYQNELLACQTSSDQSNSSIELAMRNLKRAKRAARKDGSNRAARLVGKAIKSLQ